MLPETLWKPWQPRVYFPCFAEMENTFEFTIQPSLKVQGWRNYVYPLYSYINRAKSFSQMVHEYLFLFKRDEITFDVHYLSCDGKYLKEIGRYGPFSIGESFVFSADKDDLDVQQRSQDLLVLFVASRGRFDKLFSSPGNMTARYANAQAVCGYRTGFFARALNTRKGHYGFLGLNPGISRSAKFESGILLMNHSSDPTYDKIAKPIVRLYKPGGSYLEAAFGEILPHGFLEKSYHDLFPNFDSWVGDAQNVWSVSECKGVSLASFHVYRNQEGHLLSIEHSRPSHAQILLYWKTKK